MFICKVVGTIVSSAKHPSYEGYRLLLVRPTSPAGTLLPGTMVAIDAAQAGPGDWVLMVAGGGAAFDILGHKELVPIREVVVSVIDAVEMEIPEEHE